MWGNRRCSVASLGRPSVTQIWQIKGVLAHAGLPVYLEITKDGGALCAPENGEQRTENGAPLRGDGWGRGQNSQASKPLNFQTSIKGARPARRPEGAWRASHATLWGGGTRDDTLRRETADSREHRVSQRRQRNTEMGSALALAGRVGGSLEV